MKTAVLNCGGRAAFCLGLTALVGHTVAGAIVERHLLFSSGRETAFELHPWNMAMEIRDGGLRERGRCLWFNTDWKAKPWAGVRFDAEDAPAFTVTDEWVDKGFIRFHINVTVDRHGNIGGGDGYQLRPIVDPPLSRYQALRSQFIDRGRGLDEEASTWQEVLVPLKYFTQIEPGSVIGGLFFQTRNQIERVFSLDDVEYVRFDVLPDWMIEQLNQDVSQDWVEWPAYDDLPEVVKADKRPIAVRNGAFVYPDGSRAFLLNPYCREDSRIAYASRTPGKLAPTWGLYNREKHGWIYDEIPTTENLCRLGFNSYSATPAPQAWWSATGLDAKDNAADDDFLPVLAGRVALPYYVDLVSWPWTMGKPGLEIERTDLPPGAATKGRNHWTQYRIIGAGRKAWLDMWTLNARRYRDVGARVAVLELMNEPAYMGESEDHTAQFEVWLRQQYGDVDAVNRTWGTGFATLADAAVYRFSYEKQPPPGQILDYDRYLSAQFADMIEAGVRAVTDILPETLVGLQPMGGYMRTPRDAVWKHRIARHETVVLTPTGGGRWTRGSGAAVPAPTPLAQTMADAPIENDLLLAVAGSRMIVDNETYLRGQTRADTRNRLWEHVVCGLDGLTVFSWSKRGWIWWKRREDVQIDADKFPYCALIPLARRTDALRGILDFSIEVQTLAPKILPKPWGPLAQIGFLYSWDNARRRVVEPELYDKTPAYYAALRYSHWNMRMLPADEVSDAGVPEYMAVVVAGGLTYVEPDLPAALARFVERGGILVLGECDFSQDIHGRPLPDEDRLAPETGEPVALEHPVTIPTGAPTETRFPGQLTVTAVRSVTIPPDTIDTSVVLSDSEGRPAVTCTRRGKGFVYVQTTDTFGYALAKVLHAILTHADAEAAHGPWLAARISGPDGILAPNVLISRRSYADRHAILLHNRDRYARTVRVAVPGLAGLWQVRDALTDAAPRVLTGEAVGTAGVDVQLDASGPAVLLLERPAR